MCRCWVSIAVTAALQVCLTYIPGLNGFFGMSEGMFGIQWARVLVCMVVVYIVVEIEKALVDPLLMPMVSPVLDFLEEHTPKFLRFTYIDRLPGLGSKMVKMAKGGSKGCGKPEASGPSGGAPAGPATKA
jgi:hypothetical protein